jgi:hypothetical protein
MGRKSVQQLLWETQQFYPESRDPCVSKAVQHVLTSRTRLEKCSRQISQQINTYNHLHVQVQSEQVSTLFHCWSFT